MNTYTLFKNIFLLLISLITYSSLSAQSDCGETFVNDLLPLSDQSTTVCPDDPTSQTMLITFKTYDMLAGDIVNVYDGIDNTAPLLASDADGGITIDRAPGNGTVIASSSNTSGCLTVECVINDDPIVGGGYSFVANCIQFPLFKVDGNAKIEGRLNVKSPGDFNMFIGSDAGISNTSEANTFIGFEAGKSNISGQENTFLGDRAGRDNATGSENTFLGQAAGLRNTSGSNNTFLGEDAGFNNNASDNTFVGRNSGFDNTTGSDNAFVGESAGANNTVGVKNTFIGQTAGFNNTTGNLNTFVGEDAGLQSANSSRNTYLGARTKQANVLDTLDRAIAIGFNAVVGCSNCAVIGGTGVDAVNVGLGVSNPSAKLHVNGDVRLENLPTGTGDLVVMDSDGNLFVDTGVLASMNATMEELREENRKLLARLDEVEQFIESLSGGTSSRRVTLFNAHLAQNNPNPFTENTSIQYFLPEGNLQAKLQIINATGQIIKQINLQGAGQGQIDLETNSLNAGNYRYQLIIDGRVVDSKKMVLTK